MKIKHNEIEIVEDNPFANCKLGREPYARVLTEIVNTYADGFVMAINNEWGTGKTTFVKMWQQQLKNEGFQTIYFNAWENDFDSNPLVALMSELKNIINSKNEEVFKSIIQKGAVLAKNIAPALLKALINKHVGDVDGILLDAIENTTKASTEIFEDEIKEYALKKKTIIEFRKELEKYIKKEDDTKPLVFIIDELDRCRPTYAVEVLEQIKHFFSVNGIVFVLSIDKLQLCNSIKGYYGSQELNAEEYLRRFIDIEYNIPPPNKSTFCNYLFNYFGFEDFFYAPGAKTFKFFVEDTRLFISFAGELFENENISLRQQEKLFAHMRILLLSFKDNRFEFPMLYLFLIFLKMTNNEFYNNLIKKTKTAQELINYLENRYCKNQSKDFAYYFILIEAVLIWMYTLSLPDGKPSDLFEINKETNIVSPTVKSSLDNINGNQKLTHYFNLIEQKFFSNIKLEEIINRINLTQSISL